MDPLFTPLILGAAVDRAFSRFERWLDEDGSAPDSIPLTDDEMGALGFIHEQGGTIDGLLAYADMATERVNVLERTRNWLASGLVISLGAIVGLLLANA